MDIYRRQELRLVTAACLYLEPVRDEPQRRRGLLGYTHGEVGGDEEQERERENDRQEQRHHNAPCAPLVEPRKPEPAFPAHFLNGDRGDQEPGESEENIHAQKAPGEQVIEKVIAQHEEEPICAYHVKPLDLTHSAIPAPPSPKRRVWSRRRR
jgi:hypothetical protein